MKSKFDYARLFAEIKTLEFKQPQKQLDLSNLHLKEVFANYRNGRGLRLTALGYSFLQKLNYENWTVEITSGVLKPWQKLVLDENLEWPYFIAKKDISITLFSELDYIDLKMFDGDLHLWCTGRKL